MSVSAAENKVYSEQDVHYDSVKFLMLDKTNQPITGMVKVFFPNQNIHKEIPYVSGQKHGVETWYWPNKNKRFIVRWEKGFRHGASEEFRPDGTPSLTHTYMHNQLEGKQIVYHLNGNEKRVFYIQEGQEIDGMRYHYQSGGVASKAEQNKNNQKEYKTYYKNGKIKYLGTVDYKTNQQTGTHYYRNGQIALEVIKTKTGIEATHYSIRGKKTKLTEDKAKTINLLFAYGFFRHPDTESGWDELTMEFLRELL